MNEANEMITLELGNSERVNDLPAVSPPAEILVQKSINEHYLEQAKLSEAEQEMVEDDYPENHWLLKQVNYPRSLLKSRNITCIQNSCTNAL